jgi:catalase-peroxidase
LRCRAPLTWSSRLLLLGRQLYFHPQRQGGRLALNANTQSNVGRVHQEAWHADYASDDAKEKFVRDVVAAWDKVMNLDRFDLVKGSRVAEIATA